MLSAAIRRTNGLTKFTTNSARLSPFEIVKRFQSEDGGAAKHPLLPSTPTPLKVPTEHPFNRTFRLLRDDAKKIANFVMPSKNTKVIKPTDEMDIRDFADCERDKTEFQSHCDVLIIGGGGVGASIAYWLKKRAFSGLNVVVLEKDCTVSVALTILLDTK